MIDLSKFEGHTEGPWNAYATDEGFIAVFQSELRIKGKQDCIAVLSTFGEQTVEDIANRNLIISAPELLEEVKQLRIQNEKLKCCGNCNSYLPKTGYLDSDKCTLKQENTAGYNICEHWCEFSESMKLGELS